MNNIVNTIHLSNKNYGQYIYQINISNICSIIFKINVTNIN